MVAVILGGFGFGVIFALLGAGMVLPQIIPLDRIYQRLAPVRQNENAAAAAGWVHMNERGLDTPMLRLLRSASAGGTPLKQRAA